MARTLRNLALALLAVAAAAGAIAAYTWRDEIVTGWWVFVGERPLTESQAEALLACDDPGWNALVKVLEQDLDHACAPGWLSARIRERLTARRAQWLRGRATHPGRPPRERLRAGLALLFAGQPPVRGLALLLSEPSTPADEREAVLRWLGEQPTIGDWVDPSLRTDVLLQRLRDGDGAVAADVARLLRVRAVLAGESAGTSAELVEASLSLMGLGGGRFDRLLQRRAAGLPLGDAPRPLIRAITNRGTDCADRASPSCLRFTADLLDAFAGAGQEEPEAHADVEVPGVLLANALWEVLHHGDAETIDGLSARFVETGRWIQRGGEEEAVGRLLGQVAHPRHTYGVDVLRAGRVGDPVYALLHRRAAPWTTALAAVTLGEVAGVQVAVRSHGEAVVLEAGGRFVAVGPCGERVPPPPVIEGEPWARRAILAQAAIEATGAALRDGDAPRAHQLAAFAERVDPAGAAGLVDAVATVAPTPEVAERAAGRSLGALAQPPGGAASGSRWTDLASAWAPEADRSGCPAPLAP